MDNIISRALIFLIIMLSGSLLEFGFLIPTFFIVFSIAVFSVLRERFHSKKELTFFVSSFFLISIGLILNFFFSISDDFSRYITMMAMFFLILLIRFSFRHKKQKVLNHLFFVLKIIVTYSLLNFLVTNIFTGNSSVLSFGEGGYYTKTIRNVFFFHSTVNFNGISIYRNQGLFWEPGVLAVYTNVYLFLSLFVYNEKKGRLLASLCIITTFSTTGIFLLILQYIIYLKKNKISFSARLVVFFLFVTPVSFYLLGNFQEKKKISVEEDVSSYGLRLFDFYSGALVSINNPFFGVGMNREAFIKERNRVMPAEVQPLLILIKDRGNSNSLMHVFFMFGFFLGTFILYLLYHQNEITVNKRLFFIIIIICIMGEPIVLSPFILFFFCSGFENKFKNKINLKIK